MIRFEGCGTALVTPFRADGSLDEAALKRLVRRQIDGGIDFLVPCGTTGESPTLSRAEHLRVVGLTLEESGKQVPVLAGAGGYCTADVIELAGELARMGVDGILSVTPYYNKPTQEGLYQHYRAIATSMPLPMVLYNVPGRTGVNLEPATLKRLSEIPNVQGVKEASGSLAQVARIRALMPELTVLSGDDILTEAILGVGGRGLISVMSNVAPSFYEQAKRDKRDESKRVPFSHWTDLADGLFLESNPIPVKAALAEMGLCEPVWRLPLVPPSEVTMTKLREVLRQYRLIS